jgi:ABC-type branched-subunit amino acid transport system substrate-binding protein
MSSSLPKTFDYGAQQPLKVGVMFDFIPPKPGAFDLRQDLFDGLALAFDENRAKGVINRPVKLVYREVEGLPRGSHQAVVNAFRELVDEGCLIILGPATSESGLVVKDYLESAQVPAIAWVGSDEFLGEYTFTISCGSLPDEPIQLANIVRQHGHKRVAVVYERYRVGHEDLSYFRQGCGYVGLEISTEVPYDSSSANADVVAALMASRPDAIVSLVRQLVGRTGDSSLSFTAALESAGCGDVPRYVTSAWTNGWFDDRTFDTYRGWIGLDQYDEANRLGQAVMDRFQSRFGRRPTYAVPTYAWDVGNVMSRALGSAFPLSPKGVKDALEKVKLVPSATGSPGTFISFGKWTRRGWMGGGYMVARTAIPGSYETRFAGRVAPWPADGSTS